jgi:hypothetical protein
VVGTDDTVVVLATPDFRFASPEWIKTMKTYGINHVCFLPNAWLNRKVPAAAV